MSMCSRRFRPVTLPDPPVYLVYDIDRGDAMANWSPDEALPVITGAGRTPLTLSEGLHWLLQRTRKPSSVTAAS